MCKILTQYAFGSCCSREPLLYGRRPHGPHLSHCRIQQGRVIQKTVGDRVIDMNMKEREDSMKDEQLRRSKVKLEGDKAESRQNKLDWIHMNAEKLRANDPELTSLSLRFHGMQPADIDPVCAALAHNTHLVELDLRHNSLGPEGAGKVAQVGVILYQAVKAGPSVAGTVAY